MENGLIKQKMKFGYWEPLEFIAALTMTAKAEYIPGIAREIQFIPDQQFSEMLEQVHARLSPHIKREMSRYFGKSMIYDRLDAVLSQVFYDDDEVETAEAYLARYQEQDALLLAAMLAESMYAHETPDWRGEHPFAEVSRKRELLVSLVQSRLLADEEYHAELLEAVTFPEEFKQRTLLLLQAFLEHGFTPLRDQLGQLGREGAAAFEDYFLAEPEKAFREIANSGPELIAKPTRVHVSYISQIRVDFRHFNEKDHPSWLILGHRNHALALQREDKGTVEQFLKVISDKRRLEIIALLKQGNRYGGELAHLLSLTPAAINYHTNLLIDLGLIRITRADNRIYYVLDRDRLGSFMDLSKDMLLR